MLRGTAPMPPFSRPGSRSKRLFTAPKSILHSRNHSTASAKCAALVLALFGCGFLQAATWHVSPDGNDANAGASWAEAKQSIQAAVRSATAGDTVLVTNGVYLLNSSITIPTAIQLTSVNGPNVTVLDGQQLRRCVTIDEVPATISGFTIRNGRAVIGGGVYCNQGTIQNCLVVDNQVSGGDFDTPQGGGVYLAYGVMTNCVIASNTARSTAPYQAAWAGGLYCYGGLVQDCLVSNNVCSADEAFGGGVVLIGAELKRSRVCANSAVASASASGGGLYASIMELFQPSSIEACVIAGNTANATDTWAYTTASASGGGMYIGNDTSVRSTLIERNSAKAAAGFTTGGGVWISGSTLANCTVVFNTATTQNGHPGGGGGVTWGYYDHCYNNIIRLNNADNGPDNWEVNEFSYPRFVNSNVGPFVPATNLFNCIAADPLFVNAAAGDYRLQPNSPCLNAGTNLLWMSGALDLAGRSRVQGGVADLGAYEYGTSSMPPNLNAPSWSSPGQYQFSFNCTPGKSYTILYSETLADWLPLLVTNPPGSRVSITDPSATNALRFYRVLSSP